MSTAARRSRTLLTAVFAGLLLALSFTVASPANAAGPQMENKERPWLSGAVCLEIDHGRATNYSSASVDWCSNYSQHMNWTAVSVGDGYYQLRVAHSGKCLEVYTGSHADGQQVVQYTCTSGRAQQQWKFVGWGSSYEVIARHSGKCLDKSGWNVVQWNCHGGDWQKWSRPF